METQSVPAEEFYVLCKVHFHVIGNAVKSKKNYPTTDALQWQEESEKNCLTLINCKIDFFKALLLVDLDKLL